MREHFQKKCYSLFRSGAGVVFGAPVTGSGFPTNRPPDELFFGLLKRAFLVWKTARFLKVIFGLRLP